MWLNLGVHHYLGLSSHPAHILLSLSLFPWPLIVSLVAQMVKNLPAMQETRFSPWIRKIPWGSEWQPTLVFLPGEFHRKRGLAVYNPWGHDWVTNTLTSQLAFCSHCDLSELVCSPGAPFPDQLGSRAILVTLNLLHPLNSIGTVMRTTSLLSAQPTIYLTCVYSGLLRIPQESQSQLGLYLSS